MRDCCYPLFSPYKIRKKKETNRKRNSIYMKKAWKIIQVGGEGSK